MSAAPPSAVTATYLGTATVLLRIGDLVLLTDPALDPPETPQQFRVPKTPMRIPLQRTRPACLPPPEGLLHLDAVLLSHDQHADNFDTSGRTVAARADVVVTTTGGARRLGGNAHGLQPWQSIVVQRGATRTRITATSARHGPRGMEKVVGNVIGSRSTASTARATSPATPCCTTRSPTSASASPWVRRCCTWAGPASRSPVPPRTC